MEESTRHGALPVFTNEDKVGLSSTKKAPVQETLTKVYYLFLKTDNLIHGIPISLALFES